MSGWMYFAGGRHSLPSRAGRVAPLAGEAAVRRLLVTAVVAFSLTFGAFELGYQGAAVLLGPVTVTVQGPSWA